jgi:hypothetical protein
VISPPNCFASPVTICKVARQSTAAEIDSRARRSGNRVAARGEHRVRLDLCPINYPQPMTRPVRRRKAASDGVRRAKFFIGIILVACVLAFYAYRYWNPEPQTAIVGKAWAIDGDTIIISDTHIRLEGIDAPESEQTCTDSKGKAWPCGRAATSQLRAHIRGQELTCIRRALDKYKHASPNLEQRAQEVRPMGWSVSIPSSRRASCGH